MHVPQAFKTPSYPFVGYNYCEYLTTIIIIIIIIIIVLDYRLAEHIDRYMAVVQYIGITLHTQVQLLSSQ